MKWDIVESRWSEYRDKVRARWGQLTDDDLGAIEGRHGALTDIIRQRYGLEKAEVERQIDDWMRRH